VKLYNLTSIPFALSNLALGRLKISRISELNDPFELMSANTNDISQRNALEKFKEQTNDSIGLICFSESFTNPVLWGHYADRHCGVALGFEVDAGLLLQVAYTHIKFDLPINQLTNQVECDEETLKKLLSTKFIGWDNENEWRLFCILEDSVNESGLYFERFSNELYLTEVILGAKSELPIDEMQSFINKLGYKIQVKKAKFADDKFEIVLD
jgi:hypothetical protein